MAISMDHASDWAVGLLVEVLLKSIVLAVLAGGAMTVMRVRSSTIRHRVWTAVLAGMLAMPLLTAWAPGVRLPAWAYPELRTSSARLLAETHESEAGSANTPIGGEVLNFAAVKGDSPAGAPSVATTPNIAVAPQASEPSKAEKRRADWPAIRNILLATCYAIGLMFFGARLLVGIGAARCLVRRARAIELPSEQLPAIGSTRVVESSAVRVPLTTGWLRPTIVLPSDWTTWNAQLLAAVLAHEQAHIRRRDPWVALVAQANRAVYWFHPLAWFLMRRLTALAEAACDDAVIAALGDRTGYARQVLGIASRLVGPSRRLERIGVAMAARAGVEHRIEAILDEGRPLARRVGWMGTVVLLAAVSAMALLAGGIRAGDANSGAAQGSPAAEVPSAPAASPGGAASETGKMHLKVVDENDRAVPDAYVSVRVRSVFMGQDTWAKEQVDNSGDLNITVPKPTPYLFELQVTKAGYVPFLASWESYESADPIPAEYAMHLDSGRTIGGIVHDEDGKPVEGAKVSPFFNLKMREERTRQMGAGASANTNAAGEWTYESFPMDVEQVSISYSHPGYKSQGVTEPASNLAKLVDGHPVAVTVMKKGIRFGGRVTGAKGEAIAKAKLTYYANANTGNTTQSTSTDQDGKYEFGCGEVGDGMVTAAASDFAPALQTVEVAEKMGPTDFQLGDGRMLKVRVVGPDHAPLAGAFVAFWNWDDHEIYSSGSLGGGRGKTDDKGDWQWPHAPSGKLEFGVSLKGYTFQRGWQLTPGEANEVVLSPETPKVVQRRLVRIWGRVVDAKTNQSIARFRTTAGYQSGAKGQIYWLEDSKSKGRDGVYRREFAENDLAADTYAVSLRVEADGYKPGVVREVLAGENCFKTDVALEKADAANSYRAVTPAGDAARGATVAVCTPQLGPIVENGAVIPNSTCERATADSDGRFSIDPQTGTFGLLVLQDTGAAYVGEVELTNSHTITLEPWARVEGRLKMHGRPAADEMVRLSRDESYGANAPRIWYQYQAKTDQDGKFVFERVIPGSGQVSRVAVTQLGGGASSSTPTISSAMNFVAGETTHVELGRDGRQLVGTLVLPVGTENGTDWRRAMISMQSRPKNAPKLKPIPYPSYIDPQKDPKTAQDWWNTWQLTSDGKKFIEERKAYFEAFKGFKPENFTGRVNADGAFTFDDIPVGVYHLQVSAMAPMGNGIGVGPTKVIGSLQYDFSMPDESETANESFDVGVLTLEAVHGKSH